MLSKDLGLNDRSQGRLAHEVCCTDSSKSKNIEKEAKQSKALESKNNTIIDFMAVIVSNRVSDEYSFIL